MLCLFLRGSIMHSIAFSHLDAVRALAFHPTEMCLATGGDDCTVKIWRMDMVGLASPVFVTSLIMLCV